MGKFCIQKTETGYKFDLKAQNGETVLVSEVYSSLPLCRKGVESAAKWGATLKVADLTEGQQLTSPKYEIYEDRAGQFRFRLRARNGQVIGASEGYATKESCRNGICSVRRNLEHFEIER